MASILFFTPLNGFVPTLLSMLQRPEAAPASIEGRGKHTRGAKRGVAYNTSDARVTV